ncbi:hypothetical protein HK098_005562 [Nowakowskiella sp. JEL0407]|nr:hypothetical protein HK098_005562 [Nowakowskiella sp. JEL0407]
MSDLSEGNPGHEGDSYNPYNPSNLKFETRYVPSANQSNSYSEDVVEVSSGFVLPQSDISASDSNPNLSETAAMSAESNGNHMNHFNSTFGLPIPSPDATASTPTESIKAASQGLNDLFTINREGSFGSYIGFKLPDTDLDNHATDQTNAKQNSMPNNQHSQSVHELPPNPAEKHPRPPKPESGTDNQSQNPPDPHAFHPVHTVEFVAPPGKVSQIPVGSRLFLGNLASEKTDKYELAHIFAPYGNIAEISIKQSFGFIQFENVDSCMEAIKGEQGRAVGGLNLDLKVSRNRLKEKNDDRNGRRDYDRDRRGRNRDDRDDGYDNRRVYNADRYTPSRDDRQFKPYDNRRDDSGRGKGGMGRNSRFDRDDERDSYRGSGKGSRYGDSHDQSDEFPLPRRYGSQVPECQIIIRGEVERHFIGQVESAITAVGFTVDKFFLSPKIVFGAVVKQMISEGVGYLIFLERSHERDRSVSLQVFQPNGKIQAYEGIPIPEAVRHMLQEKANRSIQPNVNQSSDISSVLASFARGQSANVDASTLLTLLGALQNQQQTAQQSNPAALLAALGGTGNPNLGGLALPTNPYQHNPLQMLSQTAQIPAANPNLSRIMNSLMSSNQAVPSVPANPAFGMLNVGKVPSIPQVPVSTPQNVESILSRLTSQMGTNQNVSVSESAKAPNLGGLNIAGLTAPSFQTNPLLQGLVGGTSMPLGNAPAANVPMQQQQLLNLLQGFSPSTQTGQR